MIHIFINLGDEGLSICQEFTFSSNGITRQFYPGIIGDYLLQSERNNGRPVYRSKDQVIIDQLREYIYLYSFNAEEYADDEIYEAIKSHSGDWMVSFTKSSMIMRLLNIGLLLICSILKCLFFLAFRWR